MPPSLQTDFGCSRSFHGSPLYGHGPFTTMYASPESLEGWKIDPQADLWAVACVSYDIIYTRYSGEGYKYWCFNNDIIVICIMTGSISNLYNISFIWKRHLKHIYHNTMMSHIVHATFCLRMWRLTWGIMIISLQYLSSVSINFRTILQSSRLFRPPFVASSRNEVELKIHSLILPEMPRLFFSASAIDYLSHFFG